VLSKLIPAKLVIPAHQVAMPEPLRCKATVNFQTKLVILLGKVGADERNTRKQLTGDRKVILFQGSHIKETCVFLLTK
jgi:hypothetical protein